MAIRERLSGNEAIAAAFEKISGRAYGFFEEYKTQDADYIMVIMGSAAGTGKDAVDLLREQGVKAGLMKIRMFRPFPAEEIAAALKHAKVIAVMDRTESFQSTCGPLGAEVKSALYDIQAHLMMINYAYGIGGRDVTVQSLTSVFEDMREADRSGAVQNPYRYLSLRA